MPAKVTQARDFFVVGGPLQPDRPCYIRRAADDDLLDCVATQRFAAVLAPRASGKSSLMARTIRRLRADGQLAAVVDFNQISPRGEPVDSARWHYSIAYRICRELRLKTELQDWWHDNNLLLGEQRLVEFFQDIVLANTDTAVTIFFDEAERAADQIYVGELFAALHACYMRRVSEPDFERLNFVALGAASRKQLCPDNNVSPFITGRLIALEDFTLAECQALASGFEQPETPAETLLERICYWTHGQPYLTQKLARGVARRGGRLADVDAVAHDLFLAPGISREEPLLHHMRQILTGPSPRRRQLLSIVDRLAHGKEVIHDPSSAAERLLDLGGFVSSDDNGMLRFRNRIVEQVFGRDQSVRAEPARWPRRLAMAAGAVAAVVLLPYWYTQVLPAPSIATLESESDAALVADAYARLGRLPGFGGVAERLYADALARRSASAVSLEEARSANDALRSLPDNESRADSLMADFWLRRAREATLSADRDVALVRTLAAVAGGSAAAAVAAEQLIDGDYQQLAQSAHLDAPPLATAVDWDREQAVVVDSARRVHRWSLGRPDSGTGMAANPFRTLASRMTALEHVGMTRGFFVDEPGRAGMLELRITLEHSRSSDVLVRLTAPSGVAAEIALPDRDGDVERFVFQASVANGLARLADESITGQWEITLFDRLAGETGRLISWGLRFAGVPQNWDDAPQGGLALPDPVTTEQVMVSLSNDGRVGVAIPSRADARGAATVWDLSSGERLADLPLADRADGVALLGSDRLLVFGLRQATLWNIRERVPIAGFSSTAGFMGKPAVSPEGGVFALAEAAGTAASVAVYRADDGALISRFATAFWQDWVLAPDARYLAGIDGSRRGRVFDPMTGELLAEFFHERELARLVSRVPADRVVAVDTAGDIFSWSLGTDERTLGPRASVLLGSTLAPGNVGVASGSGGLAYADRAGFVTVVDPVDGRKLGSYDHGDSRNLAARLDPAGRRLVTFSDTRLRYWQLDQAAATGPHFGDVSAVALDATGEIAVLGFRGGEVAFLPGLDASVLTRGTIAAETGHRGVVTSLAFNSSGELAASGGSEGVVRVWNTRSGAREPALLRHPAGPVAGLVFSADDRWLVSAGPTSVRVFALPVGGPASASAEPATEIRLGAKPQAVALAANNRILAVGDSAGDIVLAAPDGSTGEITVRGGSPVTALAFGPGSGVLASGSAAGDLVLWDTLTVAAIGSALAFNAPIGWIAFSPDGSTLYLRSGGWLHVVERGQDGARVIASSLLPAGLRDAPALSLVRDGRAIRALAHAGGGYLNYQEIPTVAEVAAVPAAAAGVARSSLADRDWRRILGLELDPVTDSIRKLGF